MKYQLINIDKKMEVEGHHLATMMVKIRTSQVVLVVENLPASAGDLSGAGSIPGSGRSLEKEMATHFSILAWKTLWTEEPGGLQSMQWQRVGHD